MLEREILKLLSKISKQLEEISKSQGHIKKEILNLQAELANFEETTLLNLEERLMKVSAGELLN